MPTHQDDRLPDGSWMTWQGRHFRGATDPDDPTSALVLAPTQLDDRFTPTPSGGWARRLPVTEVRRFDLQTYCRWRGELFEVADRSPDGLLALVWTGRSRPRAEELGLGRMDEHTWGTTVPEAEVTHLQQERRDLGPETTSPAEPASDEQGALAAVRRWLAQGPMSAASHTELQASPYRDAVLVSPAVPTRGAMVFLVRSGEVHAVPSSRTRSLEQHYLDLVARQG